MVICRLFYPDKKMYYERCVLHFFNQDQNYIFQKMKSVIKNLDISKVAVQYVKGNVRWSWGDKKIKVRKISSESVLQNERSLFEIGVKENGDVLIYYHHSLIDGESIRWLVKLIFRYVNNLDVNLDEYNGFFDATFRLNRLCNVMYPKYEIPKFFNFSLSKSTDLIRTVKFSTGLKNLHNVLQLYKGNLVSYLHHIIAKSLAAISDETIVYGCINSNRLLLNNMKVLGNFININHMQFQKSDLEDVDIYMEKYKYNMSLCNYVYNAQNKYEINVIINDYRSDQEYINMIEQKIVEMNLCCEDNNFPVNIRFDIMDGLEVNIFYRDIQSDTIFNTFCSKIEEAVMILGK